VGDNRRPKPEESAFAQFDRFRMFVIQIDFLTDKNIFGDFDAPQAMQKRPEARGPGKKAGQEMQ
jgi:hypothetical protein